MGHQQVEARGWVVQRAQIARVVCSVVRKAHVQTPSPPRAEADGMTAGAKRSPCGAVGVPIAWWHPRCAACGFEGCQWAIELRTQVLIGVANHLPSAPRRTAVVARFGPGEHIRGWRTECGWVPAGSSTVRTYAPVGRGWNRVGGRVHVLQSRCQWRARLSILPGGNTSRLLLTFAH